MASNEEYIRRNKVIIVDDDKNTKLHYAAALGNIEEIDKIVAKKQKLDPENYLGWTPLMMAIRHSNSMAMDILLNNGADASKKNKFGMSVFLISVASGDLDIVTRILNHLLWGGVSRQSLQKILSPISLSILFGQTHIFKYLLERSFDPNASTPLTGITPSMFAAAIGNNRAIKKLMQYKIDVTSKNHIGKTAADIMQTRHQKIDITPKNSQQQGNLPMVMISGPTNSQVYQLTPHPVNIASGASGGLRKSSNTFSPHTPNLMCANITPITPFTPQVIPQYFFPPDFTPSKFVSPVGSFHSPDVLNATITPSGMFISPQMCHANYV